MLTEELKKEFYELEQEALRNMTFEELREMNTNIEDGKKIVKKLTIRKYITFVLILLLAIVGTYTFFTSSTILGVVEMMVSILIFIFDFLKTIKKLDLEGFVVGSLIYDRDKYFNM